MAPASRLAPIQLRALGRVARLPDVERFYLAGASAIAWHLGHRRSGDLDLFSRDDRWSLESFEREVSKSPGFRLVATTDVMLAVHVGSVPVDFVRYPYPPLEVTEPGPAGFPVAGLLDLAAMKLAAVARRGIRRDFWDLFAIAQSGLTIKRAVGAYRRRFGVAAADLYHLERALTWFDDAEADPRWPRGLTPARWNEIKAFFRSQSSDLLRSR